MTQLTSTITIFMELNDFIYFCVHKAIIFEINFALRTLLTNLMDRVFFPFRGPGHSAETKVPKPKNESAVITPRSG